ncbi:hypothetical protein QJS10_CPB14g00192 [Acorus calamus]|uniref:SLH domain-containing protein n=1 Tax=Acorus calamus TaxID=4465 RepID=A0AAV9DEE3_ACOCL|nr:hypothetical protein QJS10_CPB14g00192 [Acorus calamus]
MDCSSVSLHHRFSLGLQEDRLNLRRRCNSAFATPSGGFPKFHQWRFRRRISSSAAVAESSFGASWAPIDGGDDDDGFGGWSIEETSVKTKKALPVFLLTGIGTSAVLLIAGLGYCFGKKGFKCRLHLPFYSLHRQSMSSESVADSHANSDALPEVKLEGDSSVEDNIVDGTNAGQLSDWRGTLDRATIPTADSVQQEALFVLKKLKIIEEDVKSDELCTRKEYARWLVRMNSLLERNPKKRLALWTLTEGSMSTAFDDVNVSDSDFSYIQALAEVGIVRSKLSAKDSGCPEDISNQEGRIEFAPEKYLSRLDLVDWKAQLDYFFMPGLEEKIIIKKVGLMDLMELSPNASPGLFMDLLAGDKSIIRKVFGNTRRLQPLKPVTKAQAAVALTSDRMVEAINYELSRLEAENSSRQAEMEEIRSELLRRGEIKRVWEEKMDKEKARGLEVQRDCVAALIQLENEKVIRDADLADHMKQKAALDCQQQLLFGLKEEVDEMRERLTAEKANFDAEQWSLKQLTVDLVEKQDAILEAKSILEAEKEALRILRSWVEDDARRSQVRKKILEGAVKRWKWDSQHLENRESQEIAKSGGE